MSTRRESMFGLMNCNQSAGRLSRMRHRRPPSIRDHTPAQTAQRVLSFLKGSKDKEKASAPGVAGSTVSSRASTRRASCSTRDVTDLFRPGRALDEASLRGARNRAADGRRRRRRDRSPHARRCARARGAKAIPTRASCAKRCAARCSSCCGRSPSRSTVDAHTALRHHARRRERQRQDHFHRQARALLPEPRQVGAARGRRHLPRRGARAARSAGASATTSR